MSRKALCVCLLALAGSGSLFLAKETRIHGASSARRATEFLTRMPDRNFAARNMSARSIPRSPSDQPIASGATAAPDRGAHSAYPASSNRPGPLSLPFAFEPNGGQADSRVAFVGRGMGLTVFLARHEIAVQIAARSRSPRAEISSPPRVVRMRLSGNLSAATGFSWRGDKKLRGETNYFIGNDPRRWRTHVPHFAQVGAANAMPGVGIVLYGNDEGIEYDLRVAPGADLSRLRFRISGADAMRLAENGDLLLNVAGGELRMKKPAIYQQVDGEQAITDANMARKRVRAIDGGYILDAGGSLGFRVGPHGSHAALVIDPSLSVAYASFLGGTGADTAASVAVDGSGKVYVSGTTTSAVTFLEAPHALGPGGGMSEFFVAKIDPTISGPNSLVYLTFLGGSGTQNGGVIAASTGGSIAITGATTSPDFPVTDSSLPTNALTSGVGNDVAVGEIDPTGSTLVFATMFGGSGMESQNGNGGIALDSSGDVYIASDADLTSLDAKSTDLPVTSGAYQATWDGQQSDGFLAIFAPPAQSGGAATLKYCSYLGTNALAQVGVGGIAVDSTGSAYIAGTTENATSAFPFTNAFQTSYGGGDSDAFLMKISPQAKGTVDLVYATLLGGGGTDQAFAVAVDSNATPSAYVTGTTDSTDFPTKGALSTTLHPNAAANAFLTVVSQNATGQTSLLYSTYLGGSGNDAGQGIAVVAPNAVYIGGSTSSWDFPWRDNVQAFNGQSVAFVAKLDPTSAGAASLTYATPLGGTSSASGSAGAAGNAVAADSMGHAYLAGTTTSPDFPTAVTSSGNSLNGAQKACASCWASPPVTDAFMAELEENESAQLPAVSFSLPRLDFFNTVPQPFGLTNTGESPLVISNMTVVGPNSADFPLSGTAACTSSALAPKTSCALEIEFNPSTTGYETAMVSVTDNAPGSPQEFELLGAAPGLVALPLSLAFPSQPEGTVSDPQQVTFTVVNPANQRLTIDTTPSLGGANPGEFQLAPGSVACFVATPLNPNSSCNVSVVFAPVSSGAFQSEVDVMYHLQGSAEQHLAVPLTGAATVPPSVSVLPSINFGSQLVQTAGMPQPITITNSATGAGAGSLAFSSASVMGTSGGDFDITSNTCTAGSTPPGGACAIQIAFRPAPAATCGTDTTRSATLMLSDNAPASPQSVALSGTAQDFCFSAPSGQAASAPISPGETATYSLDVNSSAGFSGSVALSCAGAPTQGTCTMSTSSVSVSPSTPGAFTVNVMTTAPSPSLVPPSRRPSRRPPNYFKLAAIVAGFGALFGATWSRKRRFGIVQAVQAGALLLALAALAACGGGAASDPNLGTPPGNYTITVTATVTVGSTTVTQTVQLPLTVN
jgi:hypothetical protein